MSLHKFNTSDVRLKALVFTIILILISCESFVEIDPPVTEFSSTTVYNEDATAIAAMRGVYYTMMFPFTGGFANGFQGSVSCLSGLSSDELVYYSGNSLFETFNSNSILPTDGYKTSLWDQPYNIIFHVNTILENIAKSSGVSNATKNQLMGEAKFIRAFCYFYLVNLFGDVPLIITTNYEVNAVAIRVSVDDVYAQIIGDLKDAQGLMITDYSHEGGERVRPNQWAATALLARVYLFRNDWPNAEAEATKVIDHAALFSIENNLNNVFLRTSKEAIWQLMRVREQYNTYEGFLFIPTSSPPGLGLSTNIYNTFETGDLRKTNWTRVFSNANTTRFYPYKYKIRTGGDPLKEHSMVLRLAEQYLIRAEARLQQDEIAGARNDINVIRRRAGLADNISVDLFSLKSAIEHERFAEFFSEWGHRWLDLKRWNKATEVLGSRPNWQPTDVLYPIPQSELDNDFNLVQNPGYN